MESLQGAPRHGSPSSFGLVTHMKVYTLRKIYGAWLLLSVLVALMLPSFGIPLVSVEMSDARVKLVAGTSPAPTPPPVRTIRFHWSVFPFLGSCVVAGFFLIRRDV